MIEKIHARLGTADRCADQERFLRQIEEMANELKFINTLAATHQSLQPSEATKPCLRHVFNPINARTRPWLCYALTLGTAMSSLRCT